MALFQAVGKTKDIRLNCEFQNVKNVAGFITTYHPCLKIYHLIYKSQTQNMLQCFSNFLACQVSDKGCQPAKGWRVVGYAIIKRLRLTYDVFWHLNHPYLRVKIIYSTFFPPFASHSPSGVFLQLIFHILLQQARVPDGRRITGPRVGGGSQCCGLWRDASKARSSIAWPSNPKNAPPITRIFFVGPVGGIANFYGKKNGISCSWTFLAWFLWA